MTMPRSFIIIATLLLLWNLLGILAFVMQFTADPVALARSDPDSARAFASMPGWAWAAYAIAVGAGTLGALALFARKAVAVPLFMLSIIAVVIQFGHTFLQSDLLATKGPTVAIFPAVIFLIALAQWFYARGLRDKAILR